MANISEYLSQLQTLTKSNLEILQAINNSFFTKKEHLMVNVGDSEYVIPSFISLENKINALQENFSNLVYAPKTGEATFVMDGNTRSIEVKGYQCTPNRLTINVDDITGFSVEQNDIFKDMLTPNPYIKFDLQSLPNDIVTVNVRKVAMKSDTLKDILNEKLSNQSIIGLEWADLYKILSIYKEDRDYVMYDTIRQLPIRHNIGEGTYSIKSIDNDETDSNLDEYITLTLNEDLKYKLFDETIEKYIAVGDQLVTYDDSAKMEVTYVNAPARQIKVKILNGDYLNLIIADSLDDASDNAKLKFFSPVDYATDKYINVPLEEDRYICIFIAPLNSRMNVQASWGGGVAVDTNLLSRDDKSGVKFVDYYEENVRNVGDILYEICSEMSSSIMKYSEDDFNSFTNYAPIIDTSKLTVLQINNHLDDSAIGKNIRSLYKQKNDANIELTDIQKKITEINSTLSAISFSDTTGVREVYETQLSQYRSKQDELVNTITSLINSISNTANSSKTPIENAKYRIRGYYNWYNMNDSVLQKFWSHVRGIKVQYRYKNQDSTTGSAVSIDDNFIFSDWNDMDTNYINKIPSINGGYKFKYPQYTSPDGTSTQDNGRLNEPSFNQIDIPISQGETVDIRLKIVWDFGFPFIETTSLWSSIVNIEFPEEYTKNVQLKTIVDENNDDIETNRFQNILTNDGYSSHINDKIIDQTTTFYHKPENISSGFYTSERRIIPLLDKLVSMDQSIQSIQDIIDNSNNTDLKVYLDLGSGANEIYPDKENSINTPAWNTLNQDVDSAQNYYKKYTINATLQICNKSSHVSYLYSMFPANYDVKLSNLKSNKYTIADFVLEDSKSYKDIQIEYYQGSKLDYEDQRAMQWCTFRTHDAYTDDVYYASGVALTDSQMPIDLKTAIGNLNTGTGMLVYPSIRDKDYLSIISDGIRGKLTLNAGEKVVIPIKIEYNYQTNNTTTSLTKYLSFDLRTSLYMDPINYLIQVNNNRSDSIMSDLRSVSLANSQNLTKYSSIVK